MSESEPSLLRDPAEGPAALDGSTGSVRSAERAPVAVRRARPPTAAPGRTVLVAGFWKRAAAAVIDLAAVTPVALLLIFIVGKIVGISLSGKAGLLDIDLWIDLILAADPALVMGLGLYTAIGLAYLLVLHVVLGQTLGMRVLGLRVIDIYGESPSPARCVARCAAYLAGAATLCLGFFWVGFDSEKRGLHDWIAGTYVIRA